MSIVMEEFLCFKDSSFLFFERGDVILTKQVRNALIEYCIAEYNRVLGRKYMLTSISYEQICDWLNECSSATISEWHYCCKDLYQCCWYDEYAEGIWHLTQEEVDEMIKGVFLAIGERFFEENRIAYCEDAKGVHLVLIGRDLEGIKKDYFYDFC